MNLLSILYAFLLGTVVVVGVGIWIQLKQQSEATKQQDEPGTERQGNLRRVMVNRDDRKSDL